MKYDVITVLKLIEATLIPVVLSAVVYACDKKTKFKGLTPVVKQIIIGLLFGGVAVLGTAVGIPVADEETGVSAVLNVRNAAPLAAGLIFGAPAGLIAGGIGGVYRFFATFWGAGEFSQIACTVACLLAGAFAAGCRKFMFDDKKPSWVYGFAIGGTTEVLHMLLVFLLAPDDVYGAYSVVAVCAVPMIICNAVAVGLSLFVVGVIGKERPRGEKSKKPISQVFQFLLLICVIVAFAATTVFTFSLQTRIAENNAENLLELNLNDVKDAVAEATASGANADEEIIRAVKHRRVGKTGGIIVCVAEGKDLKIISDDGALSGEMVSGVNSSEGELFTAKIKKTQSYCMYHKAGNYYLIAELPVKEAIFSRDIAVTILAFMEVIVFAALFMHVYYLLKKLIVDNIHKINRSLGQITGGDLDVHVNVRENEEFASLSDDINATVDTLKRYIAEAESRFDRELEFARQIQHSCLPSVFPPYPDRRDFDVFAQTDSAKEVGGDFYDFYLIGQNTLVFTVADVSGKGIPAALFMMRAKTLIKNLVESGLDLDAAFTKANAVLSENNEAEMFVTAWSGKLDLQSGKLEYVNAGHNPPIVKRACGDCEYLRTRPNFVLAGLNGTNYKKHEVELAEGDSIFVYTDGVTEAADNSNALYGETRLLSVLSGKTSDSRSVCACVKADVSAFAGEAEQSDDITMLCVKFCGQNEENNLPETEQGFKISLVPDKNSIKTATEFVLSALKKLQTETKTAKKAAIAVDEIYSNIVYYSGAKTAEIGINKAENNGVVLVFKDNGSPYNPAEAKSPDITLSAERREIGGLGIHMVKSMASQIKYENENGKNVLTVTFSAR